MADGIAFRKVRAPWRLKALLFWLFTLLPGGRQLYYATQRFVTRTIPRPLAPTATASEAFRLNWETLQEHFAGTSPAALNLFEFGAGWDLYGNLVYWCYGIDRQIVIDLHRWARRDQVNTVIRHLAADPPPGAIRRPQQPLSGADWLATLRDAYGIDYRAPADAARTGLPAGSVDAVVTTSTLEHIPLHILPAILAECRRVLQPHGITVHFIDYSDHYAHADPAIGPYNFLRFTQAQWRWWNPPIHFQNRLRHRAYIPLFEQAGFTVTGEWPWLMDGQAPMLAGIGWEKTLPGWQVSDILPTVGMIRAVPPSTSPASEP